MPFFRPPAACVRRPVNGSGNREVLLVDAAENVRVGKGAVAEVSADVGEGAELG